jgi:hypothetical protein
MAYQPIAMPNPGTVSESMQGLGDAFVQRNQMRRQAEQDRLEQERQQRGGFANAYMQAQALMHKGDFDGARMLLAPYSKQMQVERQEISPSMPMSTQGQQPQGGSPVPDQFEFNPEARVRDPNEVMAQRLGHAPQANDFAFSGAAGPGGMPIMRPSSPTLNDTETVEQMAKTEHPIFAARKAEVAQEQATNAKRYKTLLRGIGPDGQAFTMDPEAQREARIARLDESFGGAKDPMMQEIYQQMRPGLVSSDQDIDAGDVFRFVTAEKQRRGQEFTTREKERLALEQKQKDYETAKADEAARDARNHGQAKELAHIAADAARGRQDYVTPEKEQALVVPDLNGGYVKVRTAEAADKLRDAQGATTGVVGAVDRLKTHVITHGREGNLPTTETAAERTALIDDVTSYLTTLFSTGVLSDTEYKRYVDKLNTGLGRGGEATAKGLDAMLTGLRSRFEAKLGAHARQSAGPAGPPKTAPAKPANKIVSARALEAGRAILKGEEE